MTMFGKTYGAPVDQRRWKRQYPRDGQPWSVPEDRRLKRLVRKQFRKRRQHGRGYAAWAVIGRALGRTTCAVMTRWTTIKAVDAHLRAAAAKKARRHGQR